MTLCEMPFPRGRPQRSIFIGISVILALLFFSFISFLHYSRLPDQQTHDWATSFTESKPSSGLLRDIYNQTLGFQKILVINLPSRTDHKDAFILSSALTGIKGTFVAGVDGKGVSGKALPPNHGEYVMPAGNRGSWRAHLNAIQRIVDENLESALIVEDDIDWDIRIKSQLHQFAAAVHVLTQSPVSGRKETEPEDIYIGPGLPAPRTLMPTRSPYGDEWDMLWLGHCGVRFPEKERDKNLPRNRVLYKDETVPSSQHIGLQFGTDELVKRYANHTRAVHHTAETVCSLAYAVTQRAARQILYDIGLKELRGPYDIMLREYCDGLGGRKVRNCYTAQPQYFQHHRPVGSKKKNSDISGGEQSEDEYNEQAYTYNVRWSTRMNMQRLVDGESEFEDQWPDDTPALNRTY